ncbi:hypothetical protein AAG906_000336 [Vitis piasezkii]
MGASSGPRFSGMQKQVLGLYRGFLRAAPEFRRNSKLVDRKNFLYIEYLLRRGKKQLEQLNSPATLGLSSLNLMLQYMNNRYVGSFQEYKIL